MSQQEKKKITKVYKYPSEITPAATAATTSKSASEISEITPDATTSNETTPAPATTSKSTVTSKSKVQHMKEQYKNFKVPDSYLEKQKELRHNLDLYDDNPSLETGIIVTKLLKLVAVLVALH
jgi:hypothetical protein